MTLSPDIFSYPGENAPHSNAVFGSLLVCFSLEERLISLTWGLASQAVACRGFAVKELSLTVVEEFDLDS
jgi:hypothetical protein